MDVVYCEGWSPETRTLVGRISVAEARDRHERGEQYAVALTDGQPRVLLDIAWSNWRRWPPARTSPTSGSWATSSRKPSWRRART